MEETRRRREVPSTEMLQLLTWTSSAELKIREVLWYWCRTSTRQPGFAPEVSGSGPSRHWLLLTAAAWGRFWDASMQISNIQIPVIYLFISLFLYFFCHQLPWQVALRANESEMKRQQEWNKQKVISICWYANEVVPIMYLTKNRTRMK